MQMIEDQQTHTVPADEAARTRLAALCGQATLSAFDDELGALFSRVRVCVDELFPDTEAGADGTDKADAWSIGVIEDTPESLEYLRARGFAEPTRITTAVRAWRAGRVPATRSARAQGLLERVLPLLLEAVAATDAPDASFVRFAEFFDALPAGVQLLSLFVSEPELLRAVVDLLALAPKLGQTLARRPEVLDIMLSPDFARPVSATAHDDAEIAAREVAAASDFEMALNAARRAKREASFRTGAQTLLGLVNAKEAGEARAALADHLIDALAGAARQEVVRRHGVIDATFVVLGLGKLGGRELSATSDLDLMTVYNPASAGASSDGARPLTSDAYFARVSQRLISALSAPTDEGDLYEVDMQLRPSGKAGPIAVRLSAFERYYADEAWTWELMALTRARVVGGDAALAKALNGHVRRILRRPRDAANVATDVLVMRDRLRAERPAKGRWDIKRAAGGLVDIEFTVQMLQLVHAHQTPEVLSPSTASAIAQLEVAGGLDALDAEALTDALRLQLDLTQVLAVAVEGVFAPDTAPARLKQRMAAAGGCDSFDALEAALVERQAAASDVFERLVATKGAL